MEVFTQNETQQKKKWMNRFRNSKDLNSDMSKIIVISLQKLEWQSVDKGICACWKGILVVVLPDALLFSIIPY